MGSKNKNMTPKEKALQLFNSFRDKTFARTEYCQNRNAKDTALICVNEILNAVTTIADKKFDYYQEVKQEINKL
jgi:hypothetical protein